jgi:hypothetical protein
MYFTGAFYLSKINETLQVYFRLKNIYKTLSNCISVHETFKNVHLKWLKFNQTLNSCALDE